MALRTDLQPVQAVCYDFDGTLVDSFGGIEVAVAAAVQELAPQFSLPPLRPLIGPPLGRMLQTALPEASAELRDAISQRFRELYDGGLWCQCRLYDGVRENLENWHGAGGIPAYLVTNKRLLPTQILLSHFGISTLFRHVSATDGSANAPDKAQSLAELIRAEALFPEHCLFVGDSADDHAAAKAVAMPFVAASYGYGNAGELAPDRQIGLFQELAQFLHRNIAEGH